MPAPKERDLDGTRRILTEWLAPRLETTALELSELQGPSDTGFSSDTLMFEARIDGGARVENLVARIEPTGFNVFPSYDVSVQFRVMQALAATEVPVPRMRWLETDASVLGSTFYVMDRLDGRVPSDSPPYHVGGWLHDELAPADRERLWWNGLDAMCAIHRQDWRALGLEWLDEPERGPDPLAQHLQYYEHFFEWGLPEKDRYPLLTRALGWLRENAPKDEPVALCWGDSRISNQIYDADLRCIGVLDWEMVRLGNPLQDAVWWLTIDRCLSEGIGVPRGEGFPGRDETLARWSEATGFGTEHADYYEILGLLKFSIIMARIGLQMKHYEVLPADADMDVNNLGSLLLAKTLP
ncbi:MAG: phosphotransferase family protein [Myxococcota bacterium]|nr:phosphotransferase family protein [Myxococcota bacterium]